jgi:hypothetical protein
MVGNGLKRRFLEKLPNCFHFASKNKERVSCVLPSNQV